MTLKIQKDNGIFAATGGGSSQPFSLAPNLTYEEFEKIQQSYFSNFPTEDDLNIFYSRPQFQIPNINKEGGNIVFLAFTAAQTLDTANFNFEAEEVRNIFLTNYSDKYEPGTSAHFQFFSEISKYLDIGQPMSWESYQEIQNFYKKQRFNQMILPFVYQEEEGLIQQLPEFKGLNTSKVQQLIDNNFDFSTTNAFNRSALHYALNADSFKKLLNETDIALCDIDNLNCAYYNYLFKNISRYGKMDSLEMFMLTYERINTVDHPHETEYISKTLRDNLEANQDLYLDTFSNFFFSYNKNDIEPNFAVNLGSDKNGKAVYTQKDIDKPIIEIYHSLTTKKAKDFFLQILDRSFTKLDIENLKISNKEAHQNLSNALVELESSYMKEFCSGDNTNVVKPKILKF